MVNARVQFVYMCHKYALFVVITIRSFPHSWLITGSVTRVPRRVPHVEQGLFTLPVNMSSPPFLVGFVLPDLYFCLQSFVNRYFSICLSFFDLWLLITPMVSSNFSYKPYGFLNDYTVLWSSINTIYSYVIYNYTV